MYPLWRFVKVIQTRAATLVLTPHVDEYARLTFAGKLLPQS
jgi:NAD(P)H-hydrate repair Nnr-like enzyme with NAD(P)H-hydrate dehydratase domain